MKMSDKNKMIPPSTTKTLKFKRPSTVTLPSSSSRVKVPTSTVKEKLVSRPKSDKNATILFEGDVTMMKQEVSLPDFDAEHRQVAYGKFLTAMLEDCIVDEKIEREQTQLDIQMAQLADRFQKTIAQLDKTSRRVKDISFLVEQQRLINLKTNDADQFFKTTESTSAKDILSNLNATEQDCIDNLSTRNVDFGYDKKSGHSQLLEAVNEAIDGLEDIKKHSKLDPNKFNEYGKSQKHLEEIKKDRFDLESLKGEFEVKFPKFSEKLFKEASDMIAKMMDNDEVDRNNETDDSDD